MGLFSIFGDLNIKASDGLLKKLTEVIELYVFVWLFLHSIQCILGCIRFDWFCSLHGVFRRITT